MYPIDHQSIPRLSTPHPTEWLAAVMPHFAAVLSSASFFVPSSLGAANLVDLRVFWKPWMISVGGGVWGPARCERHALSALEARARQS
jgi:hypothetical protein